MTETGGLRCGAPFLRRIGAVVWRAGGSPGAAYFGGYRALCGAYARLERRRVCANYVLLCTTRESARLWEETGLFNLRLSSEAPNLQVENEETIEALSARTKGAVGLNPTALFICAFVCAFICASVSRLRPSGLVGSLRYSPLRSCGLPSLPAFRLRFPRGFAYSRRARASAAPILRIFFLAFSFHDFGCAFAARMRAIRYDPSGYVCAMASRMSFPKIIESIGAGR